MSDLLQLYQDIILSHNKRPRNYGKPAEFTQEAKGNNPLCGDQVSVYWKIRFGRYEAIHFEAQGCAISRASASMMTELLEGKTLAEAKECFSVFSSCLTNADRECGMDESLGDLVALSGVRKYPSRIKCATLAWHALLD